MLLLSSLLGRRPRCYWPMDLARPFVRDNWARWLAEKPEWFTPEWQARIPPEFLKGLDLTTIVPVTDTRSRQEITFRQCVTAEPWCLGEGEFSAASTFTAREPVARRTHCERSSISLRLARCCWN